MTIKTIILTLFLLFSAQNLSAKVSGNTDFLLKADDTTSFMNYEFHNLAIEAAKQKDYENAFRIYQKIAKKGDDKAEYNIGMMYMKGLGVKKGKMDAYKWLRRASKHGNPEATLFFQEMNQRYEQNLLEKQAKKDAKKKLEAERRELNTTQEKNITSAIKSIAPTHNKVLEDNTRRKNNSTPMFYLVMTLIGLIIFLGLFFLMKSSRKPKEENAPQGGLKYKAQMYDITYSHIASFHTELLKMFDLDKYKHDKKKMQLYYMFIGGAIDYFCQLEKFSEVEERRIFTTHMGNIEGKENVTAITQSILEGQRDTSSYHAQAAGGISAKEWHETGSANAFLKLKQVLTEKRD